MKSVWWVLLADNLLVALSIYCLRIFVLSKYSWLLTHSYANLDAILLCHLFVVLLTPAYGFWKIRIRPQRQWPYAT